MKKILFAITICFITITSISFNVFASNYLSDIDILVKIRNDGSARVEQTWTGNFNEGTEVFLPITTNDFTVSGLEVTKNNGEKYTFIYNWNVKATREEKQGKSGIVKTEKGIEICFGIGEYGNNTYTFSYDISSLVKSFKELDGFNFQFVNNNFALPVKDVRVVLEVENTKLDYDKARLWGFGYSGSANIVDGKAVWESYPFNSNQDSMICLMSLEKGIIEPNAKLNTTFEDVKKQAMKGSDYNTKEENSFSLMTILIVLCMLMPVILTIVGFIVKLKFKSYYKSLNYYRDCPKNFYRTNAMFNSLNSFFDIKETNIISSMLMNMTNNGCFELIKTLEEEKRKLTDKESLKLVKEPSLPIEQKLYNIVKNAANDDGILQENELTKYGESETGYYQIRNFLSEVYKYSLKQLLSNNTNPISISIFSSNGLKVNKEEVEELEQILGLRRFFEDFTLLSEREIQEIYNWEDYLVYATLFGVAEVVMKRLKVVLQDRNKKVTNVYSTSRISDNLIKGYKRTERRKEEERRAKERREGRGGSSSSGGGGGYSGGGSGGGTR